VNSIQNASPTNVLLVSSLPDAGLTPAEIGQLKNFISQGGRVLMIHPGKILAELFPDQVKGYKAKDGEIVTMHVPESPVFSEIEPLDLAWFDRGDRRLPLACTGVYRTVSGRDDTTPLADQCDIHGYLKTTSEITRYSGTPLIELRNGKGRLLASELNLESGKTDPIAGRLLINMIAYLEE
jgi:hypothetical protein